jgi:phage repressor protein C with HTH and peptisase S24 domain
MKIESEVADAIVRKLEKFGSKWKALSEQRREIALKMVILCEMAGGRDKAAAALEVSDNTIDNYRHGVREPKHRVLATLLEHVDLPLSALTCRWIFEGRELRFQDADGKLSEHPASAVRYDDPPFAYVPGYDKVARPQGFAEPDELTTSALFPWYRRQFNLEPKQVLPVFAVDDSMEPAIPKGAPVFVDIGDRDLTDGEVYVFDLDNSHRIRRVSRMRSGDVELLATKGDAYPRSRIKKSDLAHLQIVGRVRFPLVPQDN